MLHVQEAAQLLSGCHKVHELIEISKNPEHPEHGYTFSIQLGKNKDRVGEKCVNLQEEYL